MSAAAESAFGDLLKRYRRASGLTQEELAERAGLSVRGISDLERGLINAPRRGTVEALADIFNLTAAARELFVSRASSGATPLQRSDCAEARPTSSSRPRAPRLPLVGRSTELALIEQHMRPDGSPLLVVQGDPGIGKTRLLTEAAHRAGQAGWTVIQGGCQQRGGQRLYAPLLPALARYLASQSRSEQRRTLHGCEWMVRLLPELVESAGIPAPSWTVPPLQEQRLMFAAVGRYLTNVPTPTGILLVLDDLQWADQDGLNLLAELITTHTRTETPPLLRVLAAFRDIRLDAHHPLPAMLLDLARSDLVEKVPLGPLARPDAATLLRDALGARDDAALPADAHVVEQVLERAAGVPFYLTSCARELRLQAQRDDQSDAGPRVPWDIAEMVRQRRAALPDYAQEVLAVAALVGRTVSYQTLTAASTCTEQEVVTALEAAVGEHLLVEANDDAYTFIHDLIREAITADLGAARRKALHRRIAEALETMPGPQALEKLAFHYSHSTQTEKAIVYLERFADQAAQMRSHTAAELAYQEAVRCAQLVGQDIVEAALQERLGELYRTIGRYADALSVLVPAAQTYDRLGDLEGGGRVAAQMGWTYLHRAVPQQGNDVVQPFLTPEVEQQLSAQTRAALWRAHSVLAFAQGQYDSQFASAHRAVALARELGDMRALAQGTRQLGLALVLLGHTDDAVDVLQETISTARSVGDLDSLSAALNDAGALYRMRGEFEESRRYSLEAVETAIHLGDPTAITFMTARCGTIHFLLGDWIAARDYCERADVAVHGRETTWVAAYPPIERATLAVAQDDLAGAEQDIARALCIAERNSDAQALRAARAVRAEMQLLAGDPTGARDQLTILLENARRDERDVIALLPLLARTHLESGDVEQAEHIVRECSIVARARGMRLALVDALQVTARIGLARQDITQAGVSLAEALRLAQAMSYPYGEAKIRMLYGQCYMQQQEHDTARRWFEDALAICLRINARLCARQITQILALVRADSHP